MDNFNDTEATIETASQKEVIHVGISEMAVKRKGNVILCASNLGSCLGLAVVVPKHGVYGMLHALLPLSTADPNKAKKNPCMFVDTGIKAILEKIMSMGIGKEEIKLYAAGCSIINDEQGVFQIGKRNFTMLRKVLWKNNLLIQGTEVGGAVSRSLFLDCITGKVYVRSQGKEVVLG